MLNPTLSVLICQPAVVAADSTCSFASGLSIPMPTSLPKYADPSKLIYALFVPPTASVPASVEIPRACPEVPTALNAAALYEAELLYATSLYTNIPFLKPIECGLYTPMPLLLI